MMMTYQVVIYGGSYHRFPTNLKSFFFSMCCGDIFWKYVSGYKKSKSYRSEMKSGMILVIYTIMYTIFALISNINFKRKNIDRMSVKCGYNTKNYFELIQGKEKNQKIRLIQFGLFSTC